MDDILDPIEQLLADVRAARENLRILLDRVKEQRDLLETQLAGLVRSSRLTERQRSRLHEVLHKSKTRVH